MIAARFWLPGITDAVRVATFAEAACALRRSGKACAIVTEGNVSCWRTDRYSYERMTPKPVPTFTGVVGLSLYDQEMLGLRGDGTLVAWAEDEPKTLVRDVAEVALGDHFACSRVRSGKVLCWADNWMGRLGDGTLVAHGDQRPVTGVSDAIALGVGVGHGCALRADGVVLCWGSNMSSELGIDPHGSSDRRETAIPVPNLRAESLTVVRYGACAVSKVHELVCWGYGHGARRMEVSAPPAP